jgi:hypothetical protein
MEIIMTKQSIWSVFLVLALAALAAVSGCTSRNDKPASTESAAKQPPVVAKTDARRAEDHQHEPGSHGGIIVDIGRDNYHAEAIFEKGGILKLFALGKDEAKVQEVELQELTAYAKPEGGMESSTFVLKPQPQPGDSGGKTSLFVGTLPRELHGKHVEITIPSIRFAGERFRLGFKSFVDGHDAPMPTGAENDQAHSLFLTPGGIYTAADIKANGGMTAAEKYAGMRANHDMKPKAGDKVCPVTFTKANPQFTWVVGGKTYEFCCPPCIDEFVSLAKEQPAQVKEPSAYVKR